MDGRRFPSSRAAMNPLTWISDAPPRAEDTRLAIPGRRGTFFGYFLCASKESDPPQGGSG